MAAKFIQDPNLVLRIQQMLQNLHAQLGSESGFSLHESFSPSNQPNAPMYLAFSEVLENVSELLEKGGEQISAESKELLTDIQSNPAEYQQVNEQIRATVAPASPAQETTFTAPPPKPAAPTAPEAEVAATAEVPDTTTPASDRNMWKDSQTFMHLLGEDPGVVDGLPGGENSNTNKALAQIDPELVGKDARVVMESLRERIAQADFSKFESLNEHQNQLLNGGLAALGVNDGPMDGNPDAAIATLMEDKRFQQYLETSGTGVDPSHHGQVLGAVQGYMRTAQGYDHVAEAGVVEKVQAAGNHPDNREVMIAQATYTLSGHATRMDGHDGPLTTEVGGNYERGPVLKAEATMTPEPSEGPSALDAGIAAGMAGAQVGARNRAPKTKPAPTSPKNTPKGSTPKPKAGAGTGEKITTPRPARATASSPKVVAEIIGRAPAKPMPPGHTAEVVELKPKAAEAAKPARPQMTSPRATGGPTAATKLDGASAKSGSNVVRLRPAATGSVHAQGSQIPRPQVSSVRAIAGATASQIHGPETVRVGNVEILPRTQPIATPESAPKPTTAEPTGRGPNPRVIESRAGVPRTAEIIEFPAARTADASAPKPAAPETKPTLAEKMQSQNQMGRHDSDGKIRSRSGPKPTDPVKSAKLPAAMTPDANLDLSQKMASGADAADDVMRVMAEGSEAKPATSSPDSIKAEYNGKSGAGPEAAKTGPSAETTAKVNVADAAPDSGLKGNVADAAPESTPKGGKVFSGKALAGGAAMGAAALAVPAAIEGGVALADGATLGDAGDAALSAIPALRGAGDEFTTGEGIRVAVQEGSALTASFTAAAVAAGATSLSGPGALLVGTVVGVGTYLIADRGVGYAMDAAGLDGKGIDELIERDFEGDKKFVMDQMFEAGAEPDLAGIVSAHAAEYPELSVDPQDKDSIMRALLDPEHGEEIRAKVREEYERTMQNSDDGFLGFGADEEYNNAEEVLRKMDTLVYVEGERMEEMQKVRDDLHETISSEKEKAEIYMKDEVEAFNKLAETDPGVVDRIKEIAAQMDPPITVTNPQEAFLALENPAIAGALEAQYTQERNESGINADGTGDYDPETHNRANAALDHLDDFDDNRKWRQKAAGKVIQAEKTLEKNPELAAMKPTAEQSSTPQTTNNAQLDQTAPPLGA